MQASTKPVRFALKHIECLHESNGSWRLKVSISLKDYVYMGEAISPDEDHQYEASTLATVVAINQMLPASVRVKMVDFGHLHSNKINMTLFAVIMEVTEDGVSNYVTGSALFSIPMLHAPPKAVLNAVNRRLSRYLGTMAY